MIHTYLLQKSRVCVKQKAEFGCTRQELESWIRHLLKEPIACSVRSLCLWDGNLMPGLPFHQCGVRVEWGPFCERT